MKRVLGAIGCATFVLTVTIAVAQPVTAEPPSTIGAATGTTEHFPEFGILRVAGVGTDLQSSYSRTTLENRQFRRGIAEFRVPGAPVSTATLVLHENRGTTTFPLPPDLHVISFYRDGRIGVTEDDHYRTATPVATITTDANEPTQTFHVDVTAAFAEHGPAVVGFRIQLADDPTEMGFLPKGSSWSSAELIVTFGRAD